MEPVAIFLEFCIAAADTRKSELSTRSSWIYRPVQESTIANYRWSTADYSLVDADTATKLEYDTVSDLVENSIIRLYSL